MSRAHITCREIMRAIFTRVRRVFGGAVLIAALVTPAHAQAFADRKASLVDYSKAELEPREESGAVANFKSADLAQITAAMRPASAVAPAHCRVTGLLSPEIAFEVSLPGKWNGRFYMIGSIGC
jgi:hypothetical protein